MATLFSYFVSGQNLAEETRYTIKKSDSEILIDGILDENAWSAAKVGSGFFQTFPTDTAFATDPVRFRATYDENFVYLGVEVSQRSPGSPIASSLRRDFRWIRNENVSIYFDTFNDKTNGFTFQITPYNVQREGLVTLGGDVADDWDNKWYSATQRHEEGWVAEIAIPFKSIRYNSIPSWGLQILRNDPAKNERSAWVFVPLQYRPSDLIYTGQLIWDTPPPPAGTNVSIIPYGTAGINRDFEERQSETNFDMGFDAKIGVTNALNLDLTVNPDFSQVEVDEQVTNLNRFEVFFPERRQFFLENQDLFSKNGFPRARPFFSRRIGIVSDEDGLARQIPILAGSRLSGKIGKDWRLGALIMQTAADDVTGQPSQNYSVAVFQRQIFARSNIGGVFVNRQAFDFDPEDTTLNTTRYNRVYGIDYNLASKDNRWEGNVFYHRSLDPDQKSKAYSQGGFLEYRTRAFEVRWFHLLVGENFNADVGFVPRTGIFQYGGGGDFNFYPESKVIQSHGPGVSITNVGTEGLDLLDRDLELGWEIDFLNTAYVNAGYNFNSVTLQDNFDPSNSDGEELLAGEVFNWSNFYFSFESDQRKLFNYSLDVSYGGFYNGDRLQLSTEFNFRYQPFLALKFNIEYNRLEFPEPYNSTDFFLVGPRLDVTFNTGLFFTTFLQYNNQIDNFNINSRLQWRFKPVSDLFLVYTDNYDTTNFGPKNRALVLKLSYWLNL
ncbi:MAG: carbohydrate binding family 9 domain-containing protein [Cyclobacteriaceae bacterium]|nr:carbohydrate binding family 9 domain-containing protein [Cyclobacteriaceae bacterium HetDA_MAG_MS6]